MVWDGGGGRDLRESARTAGTRGGRQQDPERRVVDYEERLWVLIPRGLEEQSEIEAQEAVEGFVDVECRNPNIDLERSTPMNGSSTTTTATERDSWNALTRRGHRFERLQLKCGRRREEIQTGTGGTGARVGRERG
ncbi:uncharacterized protein BP5553_07734 [Venustampulla echinocandica]|uniref:Uncharacterized protein n=1 Tax=Venustampulla echinocandica TaxID=2656787 RepID=A0A370THD6_9HELO|nr:uncharacterized protein BP5553_07734 [Venustampulla echinocandica]RDL34606.1 hypothetical protein BP5553_07734 [Venustampulla echinocandica]